MQKKKSGVKKCLEICAIKGGGVGRLMANAILNFHFDFPHPSLNRDSEIVMCSRFVNCELRFRKICFRKKVSVSVSEKFGIGKKSRFWLQKIWSRKKIQITRTVLVMRSHIWDLFPIGTKTLKWSQISHNSAPTSKISSLWQAKLSLIYP